MTEPRNHDSLTDFRQGSYLAVKELYNAHYSLLTDFANQLIADEAEAHFIVQDTFIKLFLMRDRFNSKEDVKAFLYLTVRNTCFNYIRAEKADAPVVGVSWLQEARQADSRYDDDAVRSAALHELQQQLLDLPEPEQAIFRLTCWERRTIPATAEELNLTPVAVAQHRMNAIRSLREQLIAADLFSIPLFIYFVGKTSY